MSALDVRVPEQTTRWLRTRVLAEDRTITVTLAGRLTESGTARVVTELAEALELCCGLVVLDVTECRAKGDTLVAAIREAAVRAERTRSSIRVITTDIDIAIALDKAKISRIVKS